MGGSEAEVARAAAILKSFIELSGISVREAERRLVAAAAGTDLTRLLRGQLDLKLRHILDLLNVLDVHPLEFFRILFREPTRRSPLLKHLDTLAAPTAEAGYAPAVPSPTQRTAHACAEEVADLRRRLIELSKDVETLKAAASSRRKGR